MSSTQINRHATVVAACRSVQAFMELDWVAELPENRRIAGARELMDGYFRAVEKANGKKAAGEIKTQALNALRDNCHTDLDVEQPHTTEDWESAAWSAYCKVYGARWDQKILCQAASRILRGLELFGSLPHMAPAIHYAPVQEVIDRFFGKVLEGHYGTIGLPEALPTGELMTFDGVETMVGGMLPITIADYDQGKVPHDHRSPRP